MWWWVRRGSWGSCFCRLLAFGFWLLAFGFWLLATVNDRAYLVIGMLRLAGTPFGRSCFALHDKIRSRVHSGDYDGSGWVYFF
jgi:hypothetical protein